MARCVTEGSRRRAITRLLVLAALGLALGVAPGGRASADDWAAIEREAAGQTVYFNAWGGDLAINRYLRWAAAELRQVHGVELVHVKVTDIAETVTRIRAERAAGRADDGSADLVWINGENFAALKGGGLLYGPFADRLPNAALIDWQGNPTTRIDMTIPTEGYEVPWGTAALTLFYEAARVDDPPRDPLALLAWIEANPGRFSYPQPPAFLGTAFLKQLLLLLAEDPARLAQPAGNEFTRLSAPLWAWLDRAHASMWRKGRLFPPSGPAQRELLAVGELDWMLSYNPSEASRAIRQGELPPTIGATQFEGGALANSHYLAIPYNAGSKAGALVVANFLLSPEAQLRKADESHWGDPTVLAIDKLSPAQRRRFELLSGGQATPPPADDYLQEPHPSWTTRLESAWLERYVR